LGQNTQLISQNIILRPILDEIFLYQTTFENFSIKNVYQEWNKDVYSLSKEWLHLDFGTWHIQEVKNKHTHEYFHRPFIEGIIDKHI
jgi:hypothetical protein